MKKTFAKSHLEKPENRIWIFYPAELVQINMNGVIVFLKRHRGQLFKLFHAKKLGI